MNRSIDCAISTFECVTREVMLFSSLYSARVSRIYIIVREYVSGYFDQLFDKWVLPNIRKLNFFFLFENYRIL